MKEQPVQLSESREQCRAVGCPVVPGCAQQHQWQNSDACRCGHGVCVRRHYATKKLRIASVIKAPIWQIFFSPTNHSFALQLRVQLNEQR